MKASLLKLITPLIALSISSPALAGGYSAGQIYNLTVQDGIVIFSVTGSHDPAPGCATTARWAFDGRTAGGQVIMSAIATAFATGKKAEFHGTGTCTAWADSETIYWSMVY